MSEGIPRIVEAYRQLQRRKCSVYGIDFDDLAGGEVVDLGPYAETSSVEEIERDLRLIAQGLDLDLDALMTLSEANAGADFSRIPMALLTPSGVMVPASWAQRKVIVAHYEGVLVGGFHAELVAKEVARSRQDDDG